MQKFVYKIATADAWRAATLVGYFAGSADDLRDGYVHLSARHQLRSTLEKHFRGEHDLVLIAYETDALGPALRWETSRGGDLFPHLYGHLPVSQSLWQRPLTPGSDGIHHIDEAWFAC
jgi:uncharacterized protein (DUF952 family)